MKTSCGIFETSEFCTLVCQELIEEFIPFSFSVDVNSYFVITVDEGHKTSLINAAEEARAQTERI